MERDPVCGMTVDAERAGANADYAGQNVLLLLRPLREDVHRRSEQVPERKARAWPPPDGATRAARGHSPLSRLAFASCTPSAPLAGG